MFTGVTKTHLPSPEDCILEVVLMVSPKRQYRGILDPTTPATIFPKIVFTVSKNVFNVFYINFLGIKIA